jgi:hypothetical protein
MAERFDSPVDVEADEAGLSGLAQMTSVVIVALLTLAMLNAHALAAWADGLEPGNRSARIGAIAHGLADRTAAGGGGWDRQGRTSK